MKVARQIMVEVEVAMVRPDMEVMHLLQDVVEVVVAMDLEHRIIQLQDTLEVEQEV